MEILKKVDLNLAFCALLFTGFSYQSLAQVKVENSFMANHGEHLPQNTFLVKNGNIDWDNAVTVNQESLSKINPASESNFERIKADFKTPIPENNLWCYWYWIDDDISEEGITKDLEAMKKAGIGGALIGNINNAGKDGKVPLFSDKWWACMVHAVTEGKRIGVDIGIFNCPGWSQSGGPWVTADKSMRYLNYSETKVKGAGLRSIKMEQPKKEFQDVRLLAFPSLEAENQTLNNTNTKISVKPAIKNATYLIDNDKATVCAFSESEKEYLVELNSDEIITARSLRLIGKTVLNFNCDVSALIDGKYKVVQSFKADRSKIAGNIIPDIFAPISISLPDVVSNKFQLKFTYLGNTPKPEDKPSTWDIAEITISAGVYLENFVPKSLGEMHPTAYPKWDSYLWESQKDMEGPGFKINPDKLIDLSDKMDKNGLLTWNVPEGDWTILRIGMTPTGQMNSPSAPQGRGYEIDKMNKELVKFHFDNFVGEFLKRIPEESKSAFKYVVADSYERGAQNWTDNYEIKFKKKYGYDPIKYLPVLSGRVVGSVEESDRFLWDLRRTIADDVAYEYVGGLREASNEHHLKTWLENYGHWGFPGEFMMYGGQSDLIGGEFWNEGTLGDIECKASSSTAHAYGKNITSAEAFTSSRKSFLRHPALLKKRGDWSYTEGINHMVLHVYIQQPDDKRQPGMNAWFGTEFNRHNTWFSQADTYFDYLRRCQHLLQQGKYVADVCYFIGEYAPIMTGSRIPEIPKGYSYDYINAEVILNRLSVKNGKLVLPDGMTYSAMILPPYKAMRPEVLAKIEQLVKQGGIILGHQPESSPSLQNYPLCDQEVKKLASKLWAGKYEDGKMMYNYGDGIVFDGLSLEEVFSQLKLKKDVAIKEDVPVLWTHRTMPGMDIYFLTNQGDKEINFKPVFRVNKQLKPQLWNALTGEIKQLNEYEVTENGIAVPIKMQALQSWFIVFTDSKSEGIKKGGQTNFPEFKISQTINTPFTVDFKNKAIGPKEPVIFKDLTDWSQSTDQKIKYYSGTATYKTTFNVKKLSKGNEYFINLGKVSVMAKVKLNGKEIGGVWVAPYRLNVAGLLKEGNNQLEIEVVNLWRNRLIKDKMLPDNEKYTWVEFDNLTDNEELQPSGLLGPVVVETN